MLLAKIALQFVPLWEMGSREGGGGGGWGFTHRTCFSNCKKTPHLLKREITEKYIFSLSVKERSFL